MHMEWGYIGMLIDNDALWMVNIFFVRALIFLHETLGSCKPQTFLMLVILGLICRQTLILQNRMLIAGKICNAILVYTLPIRKQYTKINYEMFLHIVHMKCTLQTDCVPLTILFISNIKMYTIYPIRLLIFLFIQRILCPKRGLIVNLQHL